MSLRIEQMEKNNKTNNPKRESHNHRRQTLNLGDDIDISFDDFPKSLKDPKLTDTFSAKSDEDLEAHILKVKLGLGFSPKHFHGAYLARTLRGVALTSFQAKFEEPNAVTWNMLTKFLRDEFRPSTYIHQILCRSLKGRQRGKVSSYFQFLEHQFAKAGIKDTIPDQLLIALAAGNIQPRVMKGIRQDATKLTSEYTWNSFKEDCIAVDAATYVPASSSSVPHGHVQFLDDEEVFFVDSNFSSENPEERQEDVNFVKTATPARRPAYKHASDYKNDKSCRYCKVREHIAPLCNKLYAKDNPGKDIPSDLRASIQAQLSS